MNDDPYAKNPDNTSAYTPSYTHGERKTHTPLGWAHAHRHQLVAGGAVILFIKNHKLKKENLKLRKKLKVASEGLNLAADFIEGMGMFEQYFGPRMK